MMELVLFLATFGMGTFWFSNCWCLHRLKQYSSESYITSSPYWSFTEYVRYHTTHQNLALFAPQRQVNARVSAVALHLVSSHMCTFRVASGGMSRNFGLFVCITFFSLSEIIFEKYRYPDGHPTLCYRALPYFTFATGITSEEYRYWHCLAPCCDLVRLFFLSLIGLKARPCVYSSYCFSFGHITLKYCPSCKRSND
jgi:hypothetical protein